MKRLIFNGNKTEFFFSGNSSYDDIFDWVSSQAMFGSKNLFDLNEQHSCSVSNGLDSSLTISGDEDLIKVEIEEVNPIL